MAIQGIKDVPRIQLKSGFLIAECSQLDGTKPRLPFWVIETYWSCEGPRCRVVGEHFATREEAEAKVQEWKEN